MPTTTREKVTERKSFFLNKLQAIKKYFIGDLDSGITFHEVAPGVKKANWGLLHMLLGQAYRINPNPNRKLLQEDFEYNIAPLLNELDTQPDGRLAYDSFNRLSNEPHFFADTSPQTEIVRKIIIRFLGKSTEIAATTRTAVNTAMSGELIGKEFHARSLARELVLKVLIKTFFNMDYLPAETDETMQLFAKAVFSEQAFLLPKLSLFNPKYREAKQQYAIFSQNFLNSQADVILEMFQIDEDLLKPGKHFLVDLIVDAIKSENPDYNEEQLKALLKNLDRQEILHYLDSMKSIPTILILADNISRAIASALLSVSNESNGWKVPMQEEFATLFPSKKGSELSFMELKQIPQLQSLYECCLQSSTKDTFILRYINKAIRLKKNTQTGDDVFLPANSTLLFELGAANPMMISNRNILFSAKDHKRACPGFQIAELLFKKIISCLFLDQYDFVLNEKEQMIPKATPLSAPEQFSSLTP